MKKIISILLCIILSVSFCVPSFASTKSDTVTVSLNKVEDLVIDNSNYGSNDSERTLRAQIQYLTYCNDVLNMNTNTDAYNSKSAAQDIAKKKLELGYISQKEYNDTVQAVTDQTNGQQSQSNQRQQDLLTLRHMFGLDDVDKLVVSAADYSSVDLDKKLSNLNYTNALKDWELYKLSGSDATDSDNTSKVETFKKLYNSLKLVNQTYQSDNDTYQKKLADAQSMQQKLQNGYASQKDVDDINQEVQKLANTVAIDRNNVYMAYLKYDFMRDNGYSLY